MCKKYKERAAYPFLCCGRIVRTNYECVVYVCEHHVFTRRGLFIFFLMLSIYVKGERYFEAVESGQKGVSVQSNGVTIDQRGILHNSYIIIAGVYPPPSPQKRPSCATVKAEYHLQGVCQACLSATCLKPVFLSNRDE